MDYMLEDDGPMSLNALTSRNATSPSVVPRTSERRKGNMKQSRRLDDMMDLDCGPSTAGSARPSTDKGKGRSVIRGSTTNEYRVELERERQFTEMPSSSSGVGFTLLPTSPGISRIQTHARGASRSHVVPIAQNEATSKTVPLPASTDGTISTTVNSNGTVTINRTITTPTKDHNADRSSSSGSVSRNTSDDDSGLPTFDFKGLMSPPTPAPSPTPGRNGWWGTVARDASEGGVPGSTHGREMMGGFGECPYEGRDGSV
jgi:hypothetical protein